MGEAPEAERLDVIHHIPLLMLWHSYLRQDISACFPEAFATHRYPFRSTVKALPETLPEPWSLVQGPRSKHIVPWSTDLEPRIVGLGSGMLGLVSGYGSNWLEGWGRMFGVLAARSSGGDKSTMAPTGYSVRVRRLFRYSFRSRYFK